MKLTAELDQKKHEIEITRGENQHLTAVVDGRQYELEVSEPEPNIYLFKHQHRIYQIFVSPNEKPDVPFSVNVQNQNFEIKIYDPRQLRGKNADSDSVEGISEIKTAMPGKVVRILSDVGIEVKKGDGVIIVEAMKMQNELKSPKDGVVKEVRFAEGATVNAGDVLLIIE